MHVSYSEIKLWHECPYKHKLQYIDKIDGFKGNLHTAFGTAIHSVCEHAILNEGLDKEEHFLNAFAEEVFSLKQKGVEISSSLQEQMVSQYKPIVSTFQEELNNYFGACEVVSTEEKLYETMEGHELNFKGYIDLVVKTPDEKSGIANSARGSLQKRDSPWYYLSGEPFHSLCEAEQHPAEPC